MRVRGNDRSAPFPLIGGDYADPSLQPPRAT